MDATIYTDGACVPNPGRGGWGFTCRLQHAHHVNETEQYGGEDDSTNNRMEMTAPIMALRSLKVRCNVMLISDSKYVIDGATKWMTNWVRRDWKTKTGDDVKNRDLWIILAAELHRHNVRWKWVKGHSGIPGNERADLLAECGRLGITPEQMEERVNTISGYVAGAMGEVA